MVGSVPAVDEAFPEFRARSDGRGDAALVLLAGIAEALEEFAAGGERDGAEGGASLGADVAVGGDSEGDLQDLGRATCPAIEGAVAQEGFEGGDGGPACNDVGVAEEILDGGLLGGDVLAIGDQIAQVVGLVRVVAVVDAGDFEGATSVAFGELVNGEAAFVIAAGFDVEDELADGKLIRRASESRHEIRNGGVSRGPRR